MVTHYIQGWQVSTILVETALVLPSYQCLSCKIRNPVTLREGTTVLVLGFSMLNQNEPHVWQKPNTNQIRCGVYFCRTAMISIIIRQTPV